MRSALMHGSNPENRRGCNGHVVMLTLEGLAVPSPTGEALVSKLGRY